MKLIVKGASNEDIGDELGISLRTVKNTVYEIFPRLGAKNRASAVAIWLEGKSALGVGKGVREPE